MHGVRHTTKDDCDGKNWPSELRFDQEMMIGCGKVGAPPPDHNTKDGMDMYDVWNYYEEKGSDVDVGKPGKNDWILLDSENVVFNYGKRARTRNRRSLLDENRVPSIFSTSHWAHWAHWADWAMGGDERNGREGRSKQTTAHTTSATNHLAIESAPERESIYGGGGVDVYHPIGHGSAHVLGTIVDVESVVTASTAARATQLRRHLDASPMSERVPARRLPSSSLPKGRAVPYIVPLIGYNTTEHSKKYRVREKWVPFTLNDCTTPGVIKKKKNQG